MNVVKEAIIKSAGRVNAPLDVWGCTNPPDTMQTGSTPKVTVPTICTKTLRNKQICQFNSTPNTIEQWEETWVLMVSNMEQVRKTQTKRATFFREGGLHFSESRNLLDQLWNTEAFIS